MSGKVKPPLFTLRGHNDGVTAMTSCTLTDVPYLISGDEAGTVIIWNLLVYRMTIKHPQIVSSRIQSLKVLKLYIKSEYRHILVVQSRDNGIKLLDLNHSLKNLCEPLIHRSFQTVESLFSRGDALNIDTNRAILAYPSCIENHLVTIRIIGDDAETQLSGTAQRFTDKTKRKCNVFDIIIRTKASGGYLLFVAYEDGYLSMFSFDSEITSTVPVLNSTGLKVEFIRSVDLKIGDFVSAFDVVLGKEGEMTVLCGSPLDKIIIISCLPESNADINLKDIKLPRRGTSAITIRPDGRLFAVASWDNVVRLYSMDSFMQLANIKHHSKQVQNVLFINRPDSDQCPNDNLQLNQASNKKGKYLICCASMEGTISISAIY